MKDIINFFKTGNPEILKRHVKINKLDKKPSDVLIKTVIFDYSKMYPRIFKILLNNYGKDKSPEFLQIVTDILLTLSVIESGNNSSSKVIYILRTFPIEVPIEVEEEKNLFKPIVGYSASIISNKTVEKPKLDLLMLKLFELYNLISSKQGS